MNLIENLNRENKDLKNNIDSLLLKVNNLGEAANNLEKEIRVNSELTEKNSFLNWKIDTLQKQLERKVRDYDELEIQLEMSKADAESFKRENTNLETELRNYEKVNKTLKDDLDDSIEKWNKYKGTLNDIKKKYENLDTEKDSLRKDLKVSHDNIEFLSEENKTLIEKLK